MFQHTFRKKTFPARILRNEHTRKKQSHLMALFLGVCQEKDATRGAVRASVGIVCSVFCRVNLRVNVRREIHHLNNMYYATHRTIQSSALLWILTPEHSITHSSPSCSLNSVLHHLSHASGANSGPSGSDLVCFLCTGCLIGSFPFLVFVSIMFLRTCLKTSACFPGSSGAVSPGS